MTVKMSKLNDDIFFLILQELINDRKSLYSCLSVNKLLCELVVSILWRDPYKYLRSRDIEERLKRGTLFERIILFHLPESSRNHLIGKGINIIPEQRQKLLFDYIKYCQYICYGKYFHESHNLTDSQYAILNQEIIKLFISKCYAIKRLSTMVSEYPIYTFPGANVSLSKLKELQCMSCSELSFYYGLAQICRSIEKISLMLFESNSGIAHLIEMQTRIKYLCVYVDDNDYGFKDKNESKKEQVSGENKHKRISQALVKHADSILYFMLWIDRTFPFCLFPQLINLETLKLINDLGVEQRLFEKQLEMASFPNLQVLELTSISLSIATKIIENTNGNLWKVKIESSDFNNTITYIRAIINYCPNIEYVSLFINNQNLDELKRLLISCQRLEGIELLIKMAENVRFMSEKFFYILVSLAPTSLYKIQIDLRIFSLKTLDLFFINWRGRKFLHLYPLITWRSTSDSLKKYEIEGIIKYCMDNSFWYIEKYEEIEWED
ncbi:unnamed protein product [Rhizophagus irregularis]|nr:unnamed protein product [Rhizophagus irregularis]